MSTVVATPPADAPPNELDVGAMNSDQLASLLRSADALHAGRAALTDMKPAEAPTPPAKAPEPEAKKPAEAPPPEPAKEKLPEESEEQRREQLRPRLKNEEDIAIALIAKQRGITLREATKLYEQTIATPPAKEKPAEPDPVAQYDTQIEAARKEIEATRKELAKASAEMEADKVAELTDKLTDQKLALRDIETQKRTTLESRQSSAEQQAIEAERADYQTVLERYPDLRPPAKGEQPSETRAKFDSWVREQMETSDLFQTVDGNRVPVTSRWRSILAREFADLNNLSPGKRAEPAAPAKPEQPPPAKMPRTASAAHVLTTGDAPQPGSTFEASPEDIAQQIESGKLSSRQLADLMRKADQLKKAS